MSQILEHYSSIRSSLKDKKSYLTYGLVNKISGMRIEVTGLSVPVGTYCEIILSNKNVCVSEVIGFSSEITYLMCMDDVRGISPGDKVKPLSATNHINISSKLLGRVIDANGCPIDGKGMLMYGDHYPLHSKPINPLNRARIKSVLDVGVRTINSLLTVGKGQRLGIFAGSGVGKSVLLGMMTKFTKADIVIVGLIGERGREVKEFIEESLGTIGLQKSVVVASPADTSPLMRINSAYYATALAEYYRDQGKDVLLILDSLTRVAHALREIGLAAGEMPSTKGYTPSVFSKLTQLVERSGNGINGIGSITAFYTVLVEGDDTNEPISDHTRSILDGHIILSRTLADTGHYPAIDIEKSVSRVMHNISTKENYALSLKFKNIYSTYNKNKDIINIGMYSKGADPKIDESIHLIDKLNQFLQQTMEASFTFDQSIKELKSLLNG